MIFAQPNYIPLAIATVTLMATGGIWYSPAVFGTMWANAHGFKKENFEHTPMMLVQALFVAFITSWSMSQLIAWTHPSTLIDAFTVGLVAWLGLVATSHYSAVIWARKNFTVFLIDAGKWLVGILLLSAIFTLWQ